MEFLGDAGVEEERREEERGTEDGEARLGVGGWV